MNNFDTNEENKRTKTSGFSKIFKRELTLTIVSIIGVTVVLLGGSYGAFSQIVKSDDYNVLKTGDLAIEFVDNGDDLGNVINLNGEYPESDAEGLNEKPYVFEIKNTGTVDANYEISIKDDADMIESDGCINNLLDKGSVKFSLNGSEAALLSSYEEVKYVIDTGTLKVGESKKFSLNMWIDGNSDNDVIGKHFHGKIVVDAK